MSRSAPAAVGAAVRETPIGAELPIWTHPGWRSEMPWLVQGLTVRGAELGLFGAAPSGRVQEEWRRLRRDTGCAGAVHARQVHGARVAWHATATAGLTLIDDADGHATRAPGLLITVAVADCVPVHLVDEGRRAVALLHAGWRGTAAGVLEAGIDRLASKAGSVAAELRVHLGPAICGRCYEVGPEVFEALGRSRPAAPTLLDLRGVLADRALAAGVLADRITSSAHCTRCSARLYSHRGGDSGRQIAFLAVRA